MTKGKFPNQKRVRIGNKERMGRENSYQRLTNETAIMVGQLNAWGMRVWLYLNKNATDYEIDLSPQAVLNWYGIEADRRSSVRDGISELFEKGFLKEENGELVFYQKP